MIATRGACLAALMDVLATPAPHARPVEGRTRPGASSRTEFAAGAVRLPGARPA